MAIDTHEDQFIYDTNQRSSLSRNIAWYLVIIGIVLKIVILVTLLRSSTIGSEILATTWKKVHVFFPPTSTKPPENTKAVIESRIIAIVWVEFICSSCLLFLAFYSQMRLSWAPQFFTTSSFMTMPNVLYAKGISGIILVLGILRNSRFGCLPSSSSGSSNAHSSKVLVNRTFLRFNGTLKTINVAIGILVWIRISSAWSLGGGDIPKEVRIVLGGLTALMVLTDILCVILCLTVACYAW